VVDAALAEVDELPAVTGGQGASLGGLAFQVERFEAVSCHVV
jgi:hypothetical protein